MPASDQTRSSNLARLVLLLVCSCGAFAGWAAVGVEEAASPASRSEQIAPAQAALATTHERGAAKRIAQRYWKGTGCPRVKIIVLDSRQMLRTALGHSGVVALAYYSQCTIKILNYLTGYRLCQVMVHEYGHLAGLLHRKDTEHIMNPDANAEITACRNRFA